nr:MAG TPA: hypothetical protein [Caudoviricetes sp.]
MATLVCVKKSKAVVLCCLFVVFPCFALYRYVFSV